MRRPRRSVRSGPATGSCWSILRIRESNCTILPPIPAKRPTCRSNDPTARVAARSAPAVAHGGRCADADPQSAMEGRITAGPAQPPRIRHQHQVPLDLLRGGHVAEIGFGGAAGGRRWCLARYWLGRGGAPVADRGGGQFQILGQAAMRADLQTLQIAVIGSYRLGRFQLVIGDRTQVRDKRQLVFRTVDLASVQGAPRLRTFSPPTTCERRRRSCRPNRPGRLRPVADRSDANASMAAGPKYGIFRNRGRPPPVTPANVRTMLSLMNRGMSFGQVLPHALGANTSRKWRNPLDSASTRNALYSLNFALIELHIVVQRDRVQPQIGARRRSCGAQLALAAHCVVDRRRAKRDGGLRGITPGAGRQPDVRRVVGADRRRHRAVVEQPFLDCEDFIGAGTHQRDVHQPLLDHVTDQLAVLRAACGTALSGVMFGALSRARTGQTPCRRPWHPRR